MEQIIHRIGHRRQIYDQLKPKTVDFRCPRNSLESVSVIDCLICHGQCMNIYGDFTLIVLGANEKPWRETTRKLDVIFEPEVSCKVFEVSMRFYLLLDRFYRKWAVKPPSNNSCWLYCIYCSFFVKNFCKTCSFGIVKNRNLLSLR